MRSLAWCVAAALCLASCGGGPDDVARAEQLIASGQWTNARTALGQVVKREPRHDRALALLVYCLDQEGTLEEITSLDLYELFQLTRLPGKADWDRVSKEDRDSVEKDLVDARKALFDKAIDTEDTAELGRVLKVAAAYAVTHEKDVARKDRALAVLAQSGDGKATARLVDRLKGRDVGPVRALLVDIGEPALVPLRAAIADAGFLGRDVAVETLAAILASRRAAELVAERPALHKLSHPTCSATGVEILGRSVVSIASHPSAYRAHAQFVTIGEAIVVLVQAWDDSRGRVVHDLSVSQGERLVPLRVVDQDGKTVDLGGTSPFAVSTKESHVVLVRKRMEQLVEEVAAGPVRRPEPGMRVRLDGHAGSVLREDDGLWVVKMDTPIDGMSELMVARDAMTRLVKQLTSRAIEEQLRYTLAEDALVLASKHSEPWKEGDSK